MVVVVDGAVDDDEGLVLDPVGDEALDVDLDDLEPFATTFPGCPPPHAARTTESVVTATAIAATCTRGPRDTGGDYVGAPARSWHHLDAGLIAGRCQSPG